MKNINKYNLLLCVVVLQLVVSQTFAQDLEPRFLSPAPVGMNFVLAGYVYSQGNILTDAALPIEGLNAKFNSFVCAYVRTLNIFGVPGKIDFIVPYAFGKWQGSVYDVDSSTNRSGFADPMVRLSATIIGGEVLMASEYKNYREGFTLGIAIRAVIPLGQYDNKKLINLGTNRWMFKPSLGMSYKLKRWVFELHLNTWLFTTNNQFYSKNELKQDPMFSSQLHVIYNFNVGFWGAISYGLVTGGRTTLNGLHKDDKQLSEKIGAIIVFPISQSNSIKVGYTSGISARYGAKFDSYLITYQYSWF